MVDYCSNYKNGYNKIESIYESSRSANVDKMASRLSGYFLEIGKSNKNRLCLPRHNKPQPKCDNKKPVEGKMDGSNLCCVYVAVKD